MASEPGAFGSECQKPPRWWSRVRLMITTGAACGQRLIFSGRPVGRAYRRSVGGVQCDHAA